MISGLLDNSTIPVLQEVIKFSEARHNILAGNIANLDTPGYKVRDLSVDTFHTKLREAIENKVQAQQSPGIVHPDMDPALQDVSDSMESILYHDDSNVGIEQQVLQISKNQYLHNMAISIMSTQFRMMQSAIAERV